MRLKRVKIFSLLLTVVFFQSTLLAATISQIKGNKILLASEDDVVVGQEFYVIGTNGKRTGSIIKITSIRGVQAVATVVRGGVLPNQTLQVKTAEKAVAQKNNKREDQPDDEFSMDDISEDEVITEKPNKVYRVSNRKMSLLFNTMSSTMSARESDGTSPTPQIEDVSMSGTSFGITGTWDIPMNTWFEFRGSAGFEPFVAAGTARINGCDNAQSRHCNVNIGYLVAGGYSRFNVYKKARFVTWAGLGVTARFPLTKSSTAVRTSDLKLTSSYGFAAGAEYFLTNKTFIPFSVEQQYFLNSETVKAALFSLRVGYGVAY